MEIEAGNLTSEYVGHSIRLTERRGTGWPEDEVVGVLMEVAHLHPERPGAPYKTMLTVETLHLQLRVQLLAGAPVTLTPPPAS